MNVQAIAAQYGFDLVQAAEVLQAAEANRLDDLAPEVFNTLYQNHITNNTMPYEVASKGDPYEWIAEQLVA